ncbi:hypothetical protein EUX98_g8785 [Antrodiella citrinella]|uniref:NAD(P)-binding protein n=1 Tax=Antrodiella citrinella TaxID=2447956 RepID=A0A4S4M2U6_9APHY|nr:hypothetical protein EUX98_g8785 [Antrodiella citrinella]
MAVGWNLEKDIPDLTGKVVLVTGGSSGLGFATIQHLVTHGSVKGSVEWLVLDLSDPREAKNAAERFLEREGRLDILINNAATLAAPYEKTHDDIQDTMMINHISPFVWTETLLPLMEKTAKEEGSDVRIINVASVTVSVLPDTIRFRNREDFNDEHRGWSAKLSELKRYSRSKLATILFTKELQRRLDEQKIPIICVSVHPGTINTEGNQSVARRLGWCLGHVGSFLLNHLTTSSEQGAYNHVFAAVAPVVREQAEQYKGAFLMPPGKITKKIIAPAEDMELAKELWETTETLLKEIGVER